MEKENIIEYSPIKFLNNLDDQTLIDMKNFGELDNFCIGLTIDLNSHPLKLNC